MKWGAAFLACIAVVVVPVPGVVDAPVQGAVGTNYQEPYSWGAVATSGSNIYGQYSAPVTGATTLSTTSPAGGGTLGARVSDGAPVSKFAQLAVFGGGTPLFFSKGAQSDSRGTHVLIAVQSGSGAHEVWGWGLNTYGQLGNGTTTAASRPVKATWTAATGETILSLAVGERHSLMLTLQGSTRRVYAWGSNGVGQVGGAGLGVASTTKQTVPMLLSSLTSAAIQSVAAGRFHSVASDADGAVWVWGYDVATYGDIGLPGEKSRYLPQKLTATSMGQRSATIASYAIKNNVTTLTTSGYHYFEATKTATVNIGIPLLDGAKTIASVTNTTFTYEAQPNVASAAVGAGVADVTYTAPSATVSSKRISANSAYITVPTGHNYKAGNVVSVNIGDTDFDGTRTVLSVSGTEVRYESQPNVASTAASGSLVFTNPLATVTAKKIVNNLATLTLAPGHNLRAGNIVNVNIGDPAFDGTRTVTNSGSNFIQYVVQANVASTPVSPSGSITAVMPTTATVTNRSMAAPAGGYSIATLTLPVGHGFVAGNSIVVDISGTSEADFDGTWDVYDTPTTTTVRFRRPALGAAIASGSTTGSITLTPGATTVTNKLISNNQATVTVSTGHGLAAGNVIDVAGVGSGFDGRQTITGVTATTISFESQDDVTNVAASGNADIITTTVAITNKAITSNDATITLPSGHGVGVGSTITVSGLGGNFDGPKTVASVTATTATYEARSNLAATSTTGTVVMAAPTKSVTNRAITSNVATLTLGSGHGMAIGNTVTVAGLGGNFDGAKTITAITATAIEYKAQADVASAAISGTAVITDCTSSCPTVPSGVLEVAAGNGTTFARTASGVLSWGYTGTNHYNRLGRPSTGATTPVAMTLPGGCAPTQLAASPFGGAILCANNTVAAWGDNSQGQQGRNAAVNTTPSAANSPPLAISGLTLSGGENVASIDMSMAGGMVLTSTGRLFTWGSNKYRLLGNDKNYASTVTGTTMPYSLTAQVATRISPTGATVVAAMYEYYTSFVIDSDGAVWSWGWSGNSMTGRGVAGPTTTATGARFYSLAVASTARIAMMDTTYWGMATVLSDGSMWTMGSVGDSAGYYYNGDGTSTSRYTIGRVDLPFGPDTTSPSEAITQLSCGTYHCLIATSAGKIYGWGDSTYKNVVVNSATDASTPTSISVVASGLANPRIAAGAWFSLYVDIGVSGTGGTVYAYGANTNRRAVPQVATSPLTAATAVQDMITPTGTPNDVVAISAGTAHAVALRADGTLMTWGSNTYGQLGNGTTTLAPYYAEPTLPGGKIAATIHAAGNHTIVRATDGTLVGWGSNLNGVLAGAPSGNVLSPTNIATGYTFSQVDTSGHHATAAVATAVGITTAGTVMAWGSNQFGQLGRTDRPAASSGANKYSDIPVVVQTSGAAALVNADKVVATGYWGAAFRTLTSPQVPSPPLSVTADSPEASKIRAFWSAPATPRELQGYIVEVLRGGSVVFRAGAGRGATSLVMSAPTLDVLNGQEHTLRVYAVNEAGESAVSNAATATPVGVPSAPRNLSVSPRVTGLRVTFETPADLAGLPILDYEVVATPTSGSAASVTVPVGSSPYTVDLSTTDHGLVIGTSYVVTVRACNALRVSLSICGPIATSSGVIPGRPTAPLNVAALGLSGSARVSWDAPTSDGGAPIASYVVKVYADGGGTVLRSEIVSSGIAASMATTVPSLTNGTAYDITVTASQDSAGMQYFGIESDRVDVIVGRPAAPTGVAAVAHNQPSGGQVRLTWTQVPDQTGITVSHYRWRHKIGSGTFTNGSAITTGVACSGTSCAATVTGLTNGTTYTFVVEAGTSSANWGLSSAEVSETPIGVTTAPGVEATSQDSSASVGITAPVTLNGSDVIRYELKYRPTAGGAWSSTVNLQISEFPYSIAALTNGTSYTVSVEAVNDAGNSTAGTATVVPATQPGAPQNVRARPGSIIVTWDAPADTGGASVTSYDIVVTDPDGISTTFVYSGASNPAGATSCTTGRSCTITQVYTAESPETLVAIPSDVEYTVTVTAVTSAGSGPPSSDSVVVSGQPDAPTNVVATAGFESFELCWTPPSGSITSYKISAVYNVSLLQKEFGAADTATSATCASPKTGIVVTGWDDGSSLVAGGTYSLTLAATYSASDYIYGLASDSVTVTPYGLPGAPAISDITTTTSSATITWTAAAPFGSAITNYTVQASTGDMCAPTATLSCTMSGLIGNASYSFTVYATNAAGDGPSSAAVSATIDATAPTPSWGAPTIGDARRPTSTGTFDENVYFVLTFDEAVTGFDVPDLRNDGTATGCTFQKSQVTPNRVYNVVVQCASTGTLIAQVMSGTVTDSATNQGPALNVNAALVTLNDPSSTTTTVAPTTTTIQATTTTTQAGGSAPPGAGDGGTTTTTTEAGGGSGDGASGGSTSSTTTTTIGGGSGLPPTIDRRLKDDAKLVDEDPVAVGKPVSVRRCGFDPGEIVRLYVGGNLIRTTTADKDGCVEEEAVVPEAAGKKIVIALYAPTSKRGAKTTIEVVARLVATGSSVDDFVAGGFLALMTGACLVAIPRRRRRHVKH